MTNDYDYGFVLRSCYIAAAERTTEHQRLSTSDQRASAVCSLQVSSSQQRVGCLPSYEVYTSPAGIMLSNNHHGTGADPGSYPLASSFHS